MKESPPYAGAMTRSASSAASSPCGKVIDIALSSATGCSGFSVQARNSMAGTPSSVRSTPKTSWITPTSKSPGRGGTTMATVRNVMPTSMAGTLRMGVNPATRGEITTVTKLLP